MWAGKWRGECNAESSRRLKAAMNAASRAYLHAVQTLCCRHEVGQGLTCTSLMQLPCM